MKRLVQIQLYIESSKVRLSPVEIDSAGASCQQPYHNGPYGTPGETGKTLSSDQMILIDAVSRAADISGLDFEIIDTGTWGFVKKLTSNKSHPIPRIEYNGQILLGIPPSNEIVEFLMGVTPP